MAGRFFSLIVAVAVAAPLLALAAPRLAAGIALPLGRDVYLRLDDRDAAPDMLDLIAAAQARQGVLRWQGDGHVAAQLGDLRFAQARAAGYASKAGRHYLEAAAEAYSWGLSRAPLQPFAWTQLAQTRLLLDGIGPHLDPLLAMAVRTAPFEPRLVLRRLDLALLAWSYLSEDTQTLYRAQVPIAAQYDIKELIAVTRRRYRLGVVYPALQGHPEARNRFEILFRRPVP